MLSGQLCANPNRRSWEGHLRFGSGLLNPYRSGLSGVRACVRGALLALLLVLAACGSSSSLSAQSSTQPTAPAAAGQTPLVPSPSPAFTCSDATGGSVTDSTVVHVSVGQHLGYDRFVIEFGGGVVTYNVARQQSATFESGGGRGGQVTLEGSSGVTITMHSVNNWSTYSGPTAFHPEYPFLRQAQQVQNYEGYQTWALGVQGTTCLHVFTLASPDRLVVDIAAA